MRGAAIRLTLFTLFTVAITFALATVIGNYQVLGGQYVVEAVFEDATGLLKGDIVKLAGVDVGKVRSARVERGLAVVELQIDDDVQLPRSTRVEIRFRNLIGQRMVALVPTGRGPRLREGDRIPIDQTVGPLDLAGVFDQLRPLVADIRPEDINTLSEALIKGFGEHPADIQAITAGVADVAGELGSREAKVAELIEDTGTIAQALAGEREQLISLLESFATIATTVGSDQGRLERVLTQLETATGDMAALVSANRPALDQDLRDLATLLALVVNHQSDLDQIAKNLDDVLRATAKATTYGEWANLYVYSLCESSQPGCMPPAGGSTASISTRRGLSTLLTASLEGVGP